MTGEETPDPPLPAGVPAGAVRTGVDVVSIARIERLLAEFGDSFRGRVYGPGERAYCEDRADPPQHYAARWAAKEATLKALDPDRTVPAAAIRVTGGGERPALQFVGPAERALAGAAAAAGHDRFETAVSLSHDRAADRAIGQVVMLGAGER